MFGMTGPTDSPRAVVREDYRSSARRNLLAQRG